jgi:hypothetical protein
VLHAACCMPIHIRDWKIITWGNYNIT